MSKEFEDMEKEAEELQQRQLLAERNRITRYQKVFNSEDGKFVLEDLKRLVGHGLPSFVLGTGIEGLIDSQFKQGMLYPIGYITTTLEQKVKHDGEDKQQTEADQ